MILVSFGIGRCAHAKKGAGIYREVYPAPFSHDLSGIRGAPSYLDTTLNIRRAS